jgi:hypothetical protein
VKQKAAIEMKQRELAAIRAADSSIVHSTTELELLRPELPNELLHIFPLIMNIRGTEKTFKDRRDVVFVGGYQHPPNIDAVQYFVNNIMPILRGRLPGIRFYAVGSNPPSAIRTLASEDVVITGFVEDLSSLLDKMRVSVAPLRYGAGIKGKIGTAMVAGLPTIATSLAAEGMSLIDGENILVADGEEEFAEAVIQLYKNEPLWNSLSKAGLDFSAKRWGSKAAWVILESILQGIGISIESQKYPVKFYSAFEYPQQICNHISLDTNNLDPIVTAQNRDQFEEAQSAPIFTDIREVENKFLTSLRLENFTFNGFCIPCNKTVSFLMDMQFGKQEIGGERLFNWRERCECPSCRMNNRQRLVAALVKRYLKSQTNRQTEVYFMEQITPIFHWAIRSFPQHNIVGSEYLGYEHQSGISINGIYHEDVMNLSFNDNSLDLIVSNDVFEHVPQPKIAFKECARVLQPGGIMLATIPFHKNQDKSITRAELREGGVKYLLPPIYHGNPVSENGSLVFTDFGWDILESLRNAGFSEADVNVYGSSFYGHLGAQLVFRIIK